jgi:hypothetical protein
MLAKIDEIESSESDNYLRYEHFFPHNEAQKSRPRKEESRVSGEDVL